VMGCRPRSRGRRIAGDIPPALDPDAVGLRFGRSVVVVAGIGSRSAMIACIDIGNAISLRGS